MVDGLVLPRRAHTAGGGWPRATHVIKLRAVARREEFAKPRSKFYDGSQEFHDCSLSLRRLAHEPAGLTLQQGYDSRTRLGCGNSHTGENIGEIRSQFASRKAGPAAIKFPWIGSKVKYT